MNKLFAIAAAAAALGAAVPAAAQSFAPGGYGAQVGYGHSDTRRIEQRIDWGLRSGALTDHEARDLSRRLSDLRRDEWRVRRDGFVSPREVRDLDDRIARLEARVDAEMRDRDTRYRRDYGNGPGFGGERGWGGYGNRR